MKTKRKILSILIIKNSLTQEQAERYVLEPVTM